MTVPIVTLLVISFIWATLRRFILGQKLFYPDKDHFHHRLLKLGYSHRRAVLVLYGITICLGCLAFMMVNIAGYQLKAGHFCNQAHEHTHI